MVMPFKDQFNQKILFNKFFLQTDCLGQALTVNDNVGSTEEGIDFSSSLKLLVQAFDRGCGASHESSHVSIQARVLGSHVAGSHALVTPGVGRRPGVGMEGVEYHTVAGSAGPVEVPAELQRDNLRKLRICYRKRKLFKHKM